MTSLTKAAKGFAVLRRWSGDKFIEDACFDTEAEAIEWLQKNGTAYTDYYLVPKVVVYAE